MSDPNNGGDKQDQGESDLIVQLETMIQANNRSTEMTEEDAERVARSVEAAILPPDTEASRAFAEVSEDETVQEIPAFLRTPKVDVNQQLQAEIEAMQDEFSTGEVEADTEAGYSPTLPAVHEEQSEGFTAKLARMFTLPTRRHQIPGLADLYQHHDKEDTMTEQYHRPAVAPASSMVPTQQQNGSIGTEEQLHGNLINDVRRATQRNLENINASPLTAISTNIDESREMVVNFKQGRNVIIAEAAAHVETMETNRKQMEASYDRANSDIRERQRLLKESFDEQMRLMDEQLANNDKERIEKNLSFDSMIERTNASRVERLAATDKLIAAEQAKLDVLTDDGSSRDTSVTAGGGGGGSQKIIEAQGNGVEGSPKVTQMRRAKAAGGTQT